MAARSIATLSISFGLVSIPVKLYSATESTAAIRFKLMSADGGRVRQQYVADERTDAAEPMATQEPEVEADPQPLTKPRSPASRIVDFPKARHAPWAGQVDSPPPSGPAVIERSEMVKGYEFERGKFVLFTAEELKALEEGSRQTIDIVSFIPDRSVDPIYFDKPYFLAPDKRGAKPYSLLRRAMLDTGRCALAKWAFRSKEYVVQIRAAEGGLVLQQLLYAEEVRSLTDLDIELGAVGDAELQLAKQLIEQISADSYDPKAFLDEEKKRILAAVEKKIEGQEIVAPQHSDISSGGHVVDLIAALRASLQPRTSSSAAKRQPARVSNLPIAERKPVKRAQRSSADESVTGKHAPNRRSSKS